MSKYNLVNNLFYETDDYISGDAILGYTPYKELTEAYMELKPRDQRISFSYSTIPLKSISVPYFDGDVNELKFNPELLEHNTEELIVDTKLLDKGMFANIYVSRKTNTFVPLVDAMTISIFKRMMITSMKFPRIILYSSNKVNWSDIIFDLKEHTDNLTIIMSDRALLQSNNYSECNKVEQLLPPTEIFKKFNVDLQIIIDTWTDKPLYKDNIKFPPWEAFIKDFSVVTPNVYQYSQGSKTSMPSKYNKTKEFEPGKPIIIVIEMSAAKLKYVHYAQVLQRSVKDYEKKFIEMKAEGVL